MKEDLLYTAYHSLKSSKKLVALLISLSFFSRAFCACSLLNPISINSCISPLVASFSCVVVVVDAIAAAVAAGGSGGGVGAASKDLGGRAGGTGDGEFIGG